MLPYEQGNLDSLCGIYSIVHADRIINRATKKDSRLWFNKIITFLDEQKMLASILTEGMIFKNVKEILRNVMKDRIPYQKIHFAGKDNPDLNTFWAEMEDFLRQNPRRAILLGMSGAYDDHWTIINRLTKKRIEVLDSSGLRVLNRANCTTDEERGKRLHILWPAQTYFLGPSHNCH
jgi:hypothetical protein